jgi:hypothetical protein
MNTETLIPRLLIPADDLKQAERMLALQEQDRRERAEAAKPKDENIGGEALRRRAQMSSEEATTYQTAKDIQSALGSPNRLSENATQFLNALLETKPGESLAGVEVMGTRLKSATQLLNRKLFSVSPYDKRFSHCILFNKRFDGVQYYTLTEAGRMALEWMKDNGL